MNEIGYRNVLTGEIGLTGSTQYVIFTNNPIVTTSGVTAITTTGATCGGEVTYNGVGVMEKGVCWSTSQNPTTANSKTSNGTGIGTFSSYITGLISGTTYYVRAFAESLLGVSYGSQNGFTTTMPLVNYYADAWGLYHLENNPNDSSGNNRTLTNTNATFTTTGLTNVSTYRAVFNGTNAKMVGPVCYMNTDFTVSAWMTLPTTTKGYEIVNADNMYNHGWWMTCYGGTGVLGLNIGIRTSNAGVKEWYSGNKATAGGTYNMIFCRAGLRYYGYINGVKVLDNTLTSGSGQIASGNNIALQLGVRYIDDSTRTTYTSISLDDVFINKTTAWSDATCVSYYNQYKK